MMLDATDERFEQIREAMRRYHQPLEQAELSITAIVSSGPRDKNGDVCGPAVTVGGYAAMASIKITNLKQRAAMLGDVIIEIDGDRIDELSEAELLALYDHELTHVELVLDKDGAVVRDDLGRPKLKARKHDQQYGWFNEVAKRHGKASFEVKQLQAATQLAVVDGWLPGFSGG
jgi:hypothetical protein